MRKKCPQIVPVNIKQRDGDDETDYTANNGGFLFVSQNCTYYSNHHCHVTNDGDPARIFLKTVDGRKY